MFSLLIEYCVLSLSMYVELFIDLIILFYFLEQQKYIAQITENK
jgi:hypothetical protein